MIVIEDGSFTDLAKVPTGDIARPSRPLTIGQLELALLERFPREDAEEWDRMGMLAGDPSALVTGVAVALDVTREAIGIAAQAGANVLLTHHPAFLDAPSVLSPSYARAGAAGVNVYEAVANGVALMNVHTALDVSIAATRLLPGLLSLQFERVLLPVPSSTQKGYGQLCTVRASDKPFRLAHLAARCMSVFGCPPRVWGDAAAVLNRVVVANGSAGNVVEACLAAEADCLVCGELKYHAALDASQAGLAIVELGHDVSEYPLCALLAQAVLETGVPSDSVVVLEQGANWTIPDSTRI